jgi:large subunit ribosomal protein L19
MIERPDITVGDTVRLHLKIKEGNKERIQIFEGIVLSLSGTGETKTMTVRKMSGGIGVEKVIPLNMPTMVKVEIVKKGKVRKAKLYFMRNRIGKRAMDVKTSESK